MDIRTPSLDQPGCNGSYTAKTLCLRGFLMLAAKLFPVATLSSEFLHQNGRLRPQYSISCKTKTVHTPELTSSGLC
jgi:hypothetical protein